jgi:hypothetical protein
MTVRVGRRPVQKYLFLENRTRARFRILSIRIAALPRTRPLTDYTENPREAWSALGPLQGEAAECGRAAAERGPTGGGGRQKIWRVHTYGLRGLQPLEIPQNGQRFIWKNLDKNKLDLEKLAEMLGWPPSFRRLCSAGATKASLHRCAFRMHTIVA